MLKIITSINVLLAAPNGQQIGKAAKQIGKEVVKQVPKYGDDVARQVAKDPSFLSSIPTWLWIVIAVIVIGLIVYWIDEEFG